MTRPKRHWADRVKQELEICGLYFKFKSLFYRKEVAVMRMKKTLHLFVSAKESAKGVLVEVLVYSVSLSVNASPVNARIKVKIHRYSKFNNRFIFNLQVFFWTVCIV